MPITAPLTQNPYITAPDFAKAMQAVMPGARFATKYDFQPTLDGRGMARSLTVSSGL